jgi:hypothetical protein
MLKERLKLEFDEQSGALPDTYFVRYLRRNFDEDTARDVLKAFKQMGLPAPEKSAEFVEGTDGGLLFLNRYGLVIRIEPEETKNSTSHRIYDRVNDSPWVLNPLASIPAGQAVIEICPGCEIENDEEKGCGLLNEKLEKQGLSMDDWSSGNTGFIPVKTLRFPEGIPVVIDRGAVRRLTESIAPVKTAMDEEAREATAAIEMLYGPLRQSFNEAWPDPQKMGEFWRLCRSYERDGRLVAGWNKAKQEYKTSMATWTAKAYEYRLRPAKQRSFSSTLRAVPRLQHRQA